MLRIKPLQPRMRLPSGVFAGAGIRASGFRHCALQGARASKGIIFTASSFSADARDYAASVSPRVVLIDGAQLAALMIDHKVGVSDGETYVVKRLDDDYFGDES